jgi:hypothetical protein
MNWKSKALLQHVLSAVPGGEQLNYYLQTRVTKSLPISEVGFVDHVKYANQHLEAIRRNYDHAFSKATFYEFGAGWDLIIPLALYGLGVERQILVDVRSLVRPKLINDTIDKLRKLPKSGQLIRKPDKYLSERHLPLCIQLKKHYGIEYHAPCDPTKTGMEPATIDCITSTSTLEHIPLKQLRPLLEECHRLLRRGGLVSFVIDYTDHYSYFDPKISGYNYLQYSDWKWALFNPSLHYQNRLRHADYLSLLRAIGFEVLEEHCSGGKAADLQVIQSLPLNKKFKRYTLEEIAVDAALVIARKPTTAIR